MTGRHLLGLVGVLLLSGLIWLGYEEIDLLGGSFIWPYRYLLLALAAFSVLTAIERLVHFLENKK